MVAFFSYIITTQKIPARSCTTRPDTLEGIERYLGSGLIKGIGPHFARRLVDMFGVEVFDIIEQEPDRLKEVAGISQVRRAKITGAWHEPAVSLLSLLATSGGILTL